MSKLTESEILELHRKETVLEMLQYLINKYDLNVSPSSVMKPHLVGGLISAIDMIAPNRKKTTRRRIITMKKT